jgi:hypothetical protein
LAGNESKFFSTTARGPRLTLDKQPFGDGPFPIVETEITTNLIDSSIGANVNSIIDTVPSNLLQQLGKPVVWPYSPRPIGSSNEKDYPDIIADV